MTIRKNGRILAGGGGAVSADTNLSNLTAIGETHIGIKGYDATRTFKTNDVVSLVDGNGDTKLYKSLVDNNIGNPVSDTTKWAEVLLGSKIDNETIQSNDDKEIEVHGVLDAMDSKAMKFVECTVEQYEQWKADGELLPNTFYWKNDEVSTNVKSFRNVGDIFYTSRLDTYLNGAVECDGGEYYIADYIGEQNVGRLLQQGKLPYVSFVEYDALINKSNVIIFSGITDINHVLSGFSTTTSVDINKSINFSRANNWEIVVKFTTSSDVTSTQLIFDSSNSIDPRPISFFVAGGTVNYCLADSSNTWIANNTKGTYPISANSTYFVKYKFSGNKYEGFVSTDGETWTLDFTLDTSTKVGYGSRNVLGTYLPNRNLFFKGSISLASSYIKTNGNTIWTGVGGSCRCFAYDGGNTFRVPTLKDIHIEAGTASSVDEFIDESLPNINGSLFIGQTLLTRATSGAFSPAGSGTFWRDGANAVSGNGGVVFSASNSSSTYQNGSKVHPDSVKYRAMIQLATQTTDEAIATMTAMRAELDSLKALPRIIDRQPTATGGYTVCSDGYYEEWGYASGYDSQINLSKTFKNTDYCIIGNSRQAGNGSGWFAPNDITTSSFKITLQYANGTHATALSVQWKVSGFLAEGQY